MSVNRGLQSLACAWLFFLVIGSTAFAGGQDAEGEGKENIFGRDHIILSLHEIPFKSLKGEDIKIRIKNFFNYEAIEADTCEDSKKIFWKPYRYGKIAISQLNETEVAIFKEISPSTNTMCFSQISEPMLAYEFKGHLAKLVESFVMRTELLLDQRDEVISALWDRRRATSSNLIAITKEINRLVTHYIEAFYGRAYSYNFHDFSEALERVRQARRDFSRFLSDLDQSTEDIAGFPEMEFVEMVRQTSITRESLSTYMEFERLLQAQEALNAYAKGSPAFNEAKKEFARIWRTDEYDGFLSALAWLTKDVYKLLDRLDETYKEVVDCPSQREKQCHT